MDNVSRMSIETEEELEGLRRAGRVVAVVLRELRRRVQPSVTTGELDRLAGRVFARHGARSAPMLVYDAPARGPGHHRRADPRRRRAGDPPGRRRLDDPHRRRRARRPRRAHDRGHGRPPARAHRVSALASRALVKA
jgi:hypothetical protein